LTASFIISLILPNPAAVSMHVPFYNLWRLHESLRSTTAMALGSADRV
jgi:hypothetical protein